jgi:tripartite-type tricarboxylate transporter receptor subunit TctC
MLPEVPTVEQAGIKPFDIGTWFGVFATAGTPAPVLAQLHTAYSQALVDPDIAKRLAEMGSNAKPLSSAQFAEMVKQELDKYKDLVKLSGAQVN